MALHEHTFGAFSGWRAPRDPVFVKLACEFDTDVAVACFYHCAEGLITARLATTPNLTVGHAPDLAQIIKQTHRGQAHFANGPLGATCKDCVFYGCWKQMKSARGEIVTTTRITGACEKYRELIGRIGPLVPANAPACKYFERKEPGRKGGGRGL